MSKTLTDAQAEARYLAGITRRMVKTTGRIIKLFFDPHDKETSVSDMIANLMHYCAAEGVDFLECYERGWNAYTDEVMDMHRGSKHG